MFSTSITDEALAELRAWFFGDKPVVSRFIETFDKLVAERDVYKAACKQAGVCMSCVLGKMEPCTDCLGTGWDGGSPYEQLKVVEAERDSFRILLAEATAALKSKSNGS